MNKNWLVSYTQEDVLYDELHVIGKVSDSWLACVILAESFDDAEEKFYKTFRNVSSPITIKILDNASENVSVIFGTETKIKYQRVP